MIADGLDAAILDMDPDQPVPAAAAPAPIHEMALPDNSFLDEIQKGQSLTTTKSRLRTNAVDMKPPSPQPMTLMEQIAAGGAKLKSAAPADAPPPPPPPPSNMATMVAAGKAGLKNAADRDLPEPKEAAQDPGGMANSKLLSMAAATNQGPEGGDESDEDEWNNDNEDDGRNSISMPPGALNGISLKAPPAPKPRTAQPKPTEKAPSSSGGLKDMFGTVPNENSTPSEPEPRSPEPEPRSPPPSPPKRKMSMMEMASMQKGESPQKLDTPEALQKRVEQLEQEIRRERIMVRQLQNRLRGSNASNPKVKLDKCLKLIVKLIGKDRLESHMDERQTAGKTKGFSSSLVQVYKDESSKDAAQNPRGRPARAR